MLKLNKYRIVLLSLIFTLAFSSTLLAASSDVTPEKNADKGIVMDTDLLNFHFQDFEKIKSMLSLPNEIATLDKSDLFLMGNIVGDNNEDVSYMLHLTPRDSTVPGDESKAKAFLTALGLENLGAMGTEDGKSLVVSEGPIGPKKLIDAVNMLRKTTSSEWSNWIIFMSGRFRNAKNEPLVVRTNIDIQQNQFAGKLDTNAIDLHNNTMLGQYPIAGLGSPMFQFKISHILEHIMAVQGIDPKLLNNIFKDAAEAGLPKETLAHLTELVGVDIGTGPLEAIGMKFPSITLTFWNVEKQHMDALENAIIHSKELDFHKAASPGVFDKMYVCGNLPITLWAGWKGNTFILSASDPDKARTSIRLTDTDKDIAMTSNGGSIGTTPYTIGLRLYPSAIANYVSNMLTKQEGQLLLSYASANGIDAVNDALKFIADPNFKAIEQLEAIFTGPNAINWRVKLLKRD